MTPTVSAAEVGQSVTDYAKQIHFSAPPEKVFDALTTLTGLASWWAPVTGSGAEGGELCFSYGAGQTLVVHVEEAHRPSTVVWHVESCNVVPDWVGTSPAFTVTPSGAGGSELTFRHEGLGPQLECYDQCRAGWDHFLPSLHDYVESGTGAPIRA
jgi:uncharacterized protein YndB with AHSA1/START domain